MNSLKRQLFQLKKFSPGDMVSQSGVYRVSHSQHRPDHRVLALQGDVLPPCRICKTAVRFHLEEVFDYVTNDWDLAGPLLPKVITG